MSDTIIDSWLLVLVIIAFSFCIGWVACSYFQMAYGLHEPDGYCVLENLTWLDREFCD